MPKQIAHVKIIITIPYDEGVSGPALMEVGYDIEDSEDNALRKSGSIDEHSFTPSNTLAQEKAVVEAAIEAKEGI